MELAGKAAIVTGGGTGLGRCISLKLAAAGCDVAIVYTRSEQEATAAAAECAALGVRTITHQADVSRADEVAALAVQTVQELGRIDVLVNSAGTTIFRPMADLEGVSEQDWDHIMAVNVKAPWLLARAVAPHMKAAGAGAIVSISSVAGLSVSGSSMPYGVSKAALIQLTRALAVAMAPEVRVNSVAPGFLRTRWWGGTPSERLDALEQLAPLRRSTGIEDTADLVLHAITNDSMTGQTLVIDAGMLIRQ